MPTPEDLNERGRENLASHLGMVNAYVGPREIRSELAIRKEWLAPNGYLHAGSAITLPDTSAGDG